MRISTIFACTVSVLVSAHGEDTLRSEVRSSLRVSSGEEKWVNMRRWTEKFGQQGEDFVVALKEFDQALEEKVEKSPDDKAAEAVKKKYDNQIASWIKMKKEWSESNKVKVDALKATTSGLKSVIAAIKSDDTIAAFSAALEMAGSIALVVPGGQGFGLAFSFIGAVVGLSSPASKSPKPLSLEDIRRVVTDVVQKEFQNYAADQSKLNLLTKCNQIGSRVDSVYIDIGYYDEVKLFSEERRRTIANAIFEGIGNIKSTIVAVAELYSDIDTSIDSNTLVETDPALSPCFDACALMTVMYDHWAANPSKIDYVNPRPSMEDNERTFWSGYKSYWYPCPFEEFSQPSKYYNAAYKNCISHKTASDIGSPEYHSRSVCSMDKGCEKRVDRINGCRENLRKSQRHHARFAEVLMCAHKQTLALQALVQNLEGLGAVYNNFENILKGDYRVLVGNLDAQIQRLMFYFQYRSLKAVKTFTFNGNEYTCDDPQHAWAKEFGIGRFANGQEYLINGPCSSDSWMRKRRDAVFAYFEERFQCSRIQDRSKPAPNWDHINPYFDYRRFTKTKWQSYFKMPIS